MALADTWLTAVLDAGGDFEPPPDPQIPADYLQKPRRQHPGSEQTRHLSSLLPSPPSSFYRSKRRRAALAEIDLPNYLCQHKRQRVPNVPTLVMSQAPRSPSKTSNRIATRKTRNKAPIGEDVLDPNATPRPIRSRHEPPPAPAAPMPVSSLNETAMPAWTPSPSEGEPDLDMDQPTSSVTESTGSRVRSRSPTKRMVDLRVAEKTVNPKTVRSPVDVPEDVRGLYRAIQSMARVPRGVIPLGIEV